MGEARQQNHLLSHLLSHVSTSMPTLLRVLKMLSEMTESETNQKNMSEEMNNKLGETISVMAASEERGEKRVANGQRERRHSGELHGCDLNCGRFCSSITVMVAISTPIVYRPLAVRACHRTHGRTRYGRNPSPRRPRLMVLSIEAMRSKMVSQSLP